MASNPEPEKNLPFCDVSRAPFLIAQSVLLTQKGSNKVPLPVLCFTRRHSRVVQRPVLSLFDKIHPPARLV